MNVSFQEVYRDQLREIRVNKLKSCELLFAMLKGQTLTTFPPEE